MALGVDFATRPFLVVDDKKGARTFYLDFGGDWGGKEFEAFNLHYISVPYPKPGRGENTV